jgi:ankyrin repeat protein
MNFNYYVVIILSLLYTVYAYGMEQEVPAKRQCIEATRAYDEESDEEELDDEEKARYGDFYTAIKKGELEEVKKCVAQGADVNVDYDASDLGDLDWNAESINPLEYAIVYGQFPIVKFLIQKGAIIEDGEALISPLAVAAEYGQREIAEFLLDLGVNPDQAYYGNESPLYFAIRKGDDKIAHLLLKAGADISLLCEHNTMSYLHASMEKHVNEKRCNELSRLLIKKGADVNCMDINKESPLEYSIYYMKTDKDIIKQLVGNGAKIDSVKKKQDLFNELAEVFKTQPLFLAALSEKVEDVKEHIALLDTSITLRSLSLEDKKNMVTEALKYAVAQGRKEVTFYLLEAGAEVSDALKLIERILSNCTLNEEEQNLYKAIRDMLVIRASLKEQILRRVQVREKLKENADKLPLELAKRVNPTWVLVHALEQSNESLALEAIKAGANPNAVAKEGVSVLELVMFHSNLKNSEKIILCLLKAGATSTQSFLKRILNWVMSLEHPEEKTAFILRILGVAGRAGKITQEELAVWRQFFLEAQEKSGSFKDIS